MASLFNSHPDHMAVGEVAVQAVYPDARNQFAFPHLLKEGLEPWNVPKIWVMSHHSPSRYLDITENIELKFPAKPDMQLVLLCQSQLLQLPLKLREVGYLCRYSKQRYQLWLQLEQIQ